ncbi:MAG: T9SS type A sorting domain-containing protein [Hymenobacter sp.]|nr:T9SS type A sorting domain-containing protein [Hymenobacter sp.]
MKTLLLLFSALCLSYSLAVVPAAAQNVPNPGFESWVTQGAAEYPVGWLSLDLRAAQGSPFQGTVTRSTDRYAGSAAVKMESKSFFGVPFPSLLILGSRFTSGGAFGLGSIPYTGRPATLQFWYKLTLAPADSAGAYLVLTRGGGPATQPVGTGAAVLPARATYGQYSIPITYLTGSAPDSLRLFFVCGNGVVTGSSSLWLDEVSLTGTVAATPQAAALAALSVYPNPSTTGEFSLASLQNPAIAAAPYRVYNATGRLVRQQAAVPLNEANGRRVDLRGLPAGVYLLHLSTADGPLTRKLLIP